MARLILEIYNDVRGDNKLDSIVLVRAIYKETK